MGASPVGHILETERDGLIRCINTQKSEDGEGEGSTKCTNPVAALQSGKCCRPTPRGLLNFHCVRFGYNRVEQVSFNNHINLMLVDLRRHRAKPMPPYGCRQLSAVRKSGAHRGAPCETKGRQDNERPRPSCTGSV